MNKFESRRVALLATCLVDQFFPQVGLSTLKVLRRCGIRAGFPRAQTCCGQPFFNMGCRDEARRVARHTLAVFEEFDAVVVPSGSCASMIRVYYPDLLGPDALRLAPKTFELTRFLVRELGRDDVGSGYRGAVTYHDGCHALRELRVRDEPRRLLRAVPGCRLVEMNGSDQCCGFGGTFSVKFGALSTEMAADKIRSIAATGAGAVVSTDASCLMQLSGLASRRGLGVRGLHIAEVLGA
jgi:L-lactate dehydrogenase complex protein LldE